MDPGMPGVICDQGKLPDPGIIPDQGEPPIPGTMPVQGDPPIPGIMPDQGDIPRFDMVPIPDQENESNGDASIMASKGSLSGKGLELSSIPMASSIARIPVTKGFSAAETGVAIKANNKMKRGLWRVLHRPGDLAYIIMRLVVT